MFTDVPRSPDTSYSQGTQAIITTGTIGTQCALRVLISSSSQTEKAVPVLEVDDTLSGASSERFPVSQDDADIAVETGFYSCICRPHAGNTRSFSNGSGKIQFEGNLYSCLSCQQRNHQVADVQVDSASVMPCICTVCKNVFHEKCSLDAHMRVHKITRQHICDICHKSFTQKKYLVKHEKLHSGNKPYICSICQKSFAQRHHLVSHERLHSGEKPYTCSICQKSFSHRSNMVSHKRSHSGEKPYMCSLCQKSFTTKRNLVHHEMLHSGHRPYMCSICQKGFTQKRYLVGHEKLHSNEKPYVCNICHKSFAVKHYLTRHKETHIGSNTIALSSISEKQISSFLLYFM